MVTSKIILILKKLDKKELSDFRDFLRSPYFNNKSKLIDFYDKLVKYYPDFDEKKINKKSIYKSLYKESNFNPQVYKNLCSELYSLGRKFLSVQNFEKRDIEKDMLLIKSLGSKGSDELYQIEVNALRKKMNRADFDEQLFYYKFDLAANEKHFYYIRNNPKKGLEFGTEEGDELLKYFLVNLSRLVFDYTLSKQNFNVEFNTNAAKSFADEILKAGLFEKIINYIEVNKLEHYEIVAFYYYIMLALLNPDNDDFYIKAKELLFGNIKKFARPQQYILSNTLFTICTVKINHFQRIIDYEKAFEVINFQFNEKLYKTFDDSYITIYKFRSVFMIGFYLKKFDWLKKVLKKYLPEIAPEYRENVRNHLNAFLKFYEKDYEGSLELLKKVKFDQFIYKMDVRNLQLFIYYELGHHESALSLIVSYKEFLKSNKNVSEEFRKLYSSVANFIYKLINIASKFDRFKLQKLEEEISKMQYVVNRDWFEEKIAILKKNNIKY